MGQRGKSEHLRAVLGVKNTFLGPISVVSEIPWVSLVRVGKYEKSLKKFEILHVWDSTPYLWYERSYARCWATLFLWEKSTHIWGRKGTPTNVGVSSHRQSEPVRKRLTLDMRLWFTSFGNYYICPLKKSAMVGTQYLHYFWRKQLRSYNIWRR